MNYNLKVKTLDKLASLITSETTYRSGPDLIKFFNPLGFNDSYGQGFPSRLRFAENKLIELNGTPKIIECIKNLFDPINFVNEDERFEKLLKEFNNFLKFDDLKIIKNKKKVEVIELNEDFEDYEDEESILPSDINRIWGKGINFKVFLSHKAENKKEASNLKNNLRVYGISCFVAHEDIVPTLEWQTEIEKSLFSADALIAILTKDFHNSNWTDQEIGIAYGRKIPMISLRLGTEPYGFIGKFQGLKINLDTEYEKIAGIFLKQKSMVDAYIEKVKISGSYEISNKLGIMLKYIENLSEQQIDNLIKIFRENDQVAKAAGFTGAYPHSCGYGLKYELKRITGKDYIL